MTTAARIGWGTILKRGDGGDPESFTSLGETKDISGPNIQTGFLDATHNESPEGYREYILDLKDGGEVTFTMNYDPTNAGQEGLRDDADDRTIRNFQLDEAGDGEPTIGFSAYVQNYSINRPTTGIRELSITLKVSGDVDWEVT